MSTKRLILSAGEKGGTGKSVWSIGFIDYCRSNNIPVAAYDADGRVGSLLLMHGQRDAAGRLLADQDSLKGVVGYNVRSEAERGVLANSLVSEADIVFHDLAGGSAVELARINLDGVRDDDDLAEGARRLLESIARRGRKVTFVHTLSTDIAATSSVATYLKLFVDADHLIVRNRFFGKELPFWDGFTNGKGEKKGGATKSEFLARGGTQIELPALPAATAAKIRAENMVASRGREDPTLMPVEQDHCANFFNENAVQLRKAAAVLGI
jgi:hypothetical protein